MVCNGMIQVNVPLNNKLKSIECKYENFYYDSFELQADDYVTRGELRDWAFTHKIIVQLLVTCKNW